ncbi:MAG: hypothetical protein D6822_04545 [Cyanobacteria bacterium J149]|nr:MAG: hypothetical protein D6822_04545 [Cyanobacteria bacterium J149]
MRRKTKWESPKSYRVKNGRGLNPHLLDPKEIPEFNWKTPELERLYNMNRKVMDEIRNSTQSHQLE